MLTRQPTLVLPKINNTHSSNRLEVSNKWKKAERRVTVISFPKIKIRKKEQQKKLAREEAFSKLPIIEAEFRNETDYFGYYLKDDKIEINDESIELEKFALFCGKDETQESITTKYFSEKGRELLKERQYEILKESDVLKQKENQVFNQATTNSKSFEKHYYFMVEDFARLSFELCSLNSSMQQINGIKREVQDNDPKEKVRLIQKEIMKEEIWIEKIEQEIIKIVQ